MEYLPDEIYLSAEYSRIDELHWYNVQTNSEYRNIIQEALLKLMISQEYEYVNRLAENVKRKLENKREESKTWYRIWLEIETVTEKRIMDMRLWTRIKLMEESQHFVLKHYVREYVKKAYIGHLKYWMQK